MSLQDAAQRALLVNAVNTPLVQNSLLPTLTVPQKTARLSLIGELSSPFLKDVGETNTRTNLTLRLWSGCLWAAKTIALETLDGPNSANQRLLSFTRDIDPIAQVDPIFRAGVEAAPAFKRLQNQEISLDGVPLTSPVRKLA